MSLFFISATDLLWIWISYPILWGSVIHLKIEIKMTPISLFYGKV